MKRTLQQNLVILLAGVLTVMLAGCSEVAITGRQQLNFVPDSIINSMSLSEYNTFLKDPETKLSTDAEKTATVQRVGAKIADENDLVDAACHVALRKTESGEMIRRL